MEVINKTKIAIDSEIIEFLEIIKNSVCQNELELIFVDEREIQSLNKEFLGRDYATDVLSFGLDFSEIKIENPPLGSIVISLPCAISMSQKLKHSLKDEMAILFTHALLHLLGFDHEKDRGEHRQKESEILARFGIESSLIARANLL